MRSFRFPNKKRKIALELDTKVQTDNVSKKELPPTYLIAWEETNGDRCQSNHRDGDLSRLFD